MQKVQAYKKKTGQKTEMVRAAATILMRTLGSPVSSTAKYGRFDFWSG